MHYWHSSCCSKLTQNMGSSKKSCRAFSNHVDCLEQKEFLQWNTRTKDYLCANFQDICLSSKSWIYGIKYAISTIKMQILNQFFRKKIVVIRVPSFHQPVRSSSFFLAFCLKFYGTTFYGWPYIIPTLRALLAPSRRALARWFRTAYDSDENNRPLAYMFACSLASLTHLLPRTARFFWKSDIHIGFLKRKRLAVSSACKVMGGIVTSNITTLWRNCKRGSGSGGSGGSCRRGGSGGSGGSGPDIDRSKTLYSRPIILAAVNHSASSGFLRVSRLPFPL